jgi:hypothetical protein
MRRGANPVPLLPPRLAATGRGFYLKFFLIPHFRPPLYLLTTKPAIETAGLIFRRHAPDHIYQ